MDGKHEFVAVTGEALGTEGIEQLTERAEAVCAWERTRIELANEPALVRRRVEYAAAIEAERVLQARLAQVTPSPDGKSRRRKITICWIVATVLIASGFVLTLLTLEPYRLGLKAVVYCLGIAIVVPFLAEKVLELFASETLKKVMAAVACLTGLASLILLATIRGNLLAEQVRQQDAASAVIEGEEPQDSAVKDTFYEDTVPLLQLVMALLAFSMEIGAGIAVHEAERLSGTEDGEYESLRRELGEVHGRLALLAEETVALQNEAPGFTAQFWRDFYWSLLKGTLKRAAKRFIAPALILALFCPRVVFAQASIDLVVAVDLSKSVDRAGPDGRTEFAKNIGAVTRLLGSIPAGTHLTVIGITGNTFGQPYILLSASVGSDEGYFGEKTAAARRRLVAAWKSRSERLRPRYARTDILGALRLASQLFHEAGPGRRCILVIFSDMQQETRELDIAKAVRHGANPLGDGRSAGLQTNLKGVDIHVLGAEAGNKRPNEWEAIKDFWSAYFSTGGARLVQYSPLRQFQAVIIEEPVASVGIPTKSQDSFDFRRK